MVRDVLHCRPGKVRDLVEKFGSVAEAMEEAGMTPFRMYTDISGERFWTLVLEAEHESMETFMEALSAIMSDERMKSAMAGYHELVESGRREIYQVEA
jgi:hypothetical protein